MGSAELAGPAVVECEPVLMVYADDVSSVEVCGNNIRLTFVQYRTIGGQKVAVPVLELLRPCYTLGEVFAKIMSLTRPALH